MLNFIRALLRAIFGVLTLPLQWLGWQPEPQASDVAEAAVAAVRADPIEAPPPVPREPTPMADLVLAHVRARLYTHERHGPLVPLPTALAAWVESLDGQEMGDVICAQGLPLQKHINRGLAGSTALGPYRLPPVRPDAVPNPAKRGATGGTGVTRGQDLSAALEELGLVFETSYSPRLR